MPLHLLDNLSNLSDPASARSVLGLGSTDSPTFNGLSATTANFSRISAVEYDVTGTEGMLVRSTDIRTWVRGTNEFYVGSQESQPQGLTFKPDGSMMFVTGQITDRVWGYTLTTPWNTTTAINPVSALVTGAPCAMYFTGDGSKMFVLDTSSDLVGRYSLSPVWDVSTATLDSGQTKVFSTITGMPAGTSFDPRGLEFSPDGLKLFVCDDFQNRIYEISLQFAWDLTSTMTLVTSYLIVTTIDNGLRNISFNNDGTRLFVVGTTSTRIYEFKLATPYSLANVTYIGRTTETANDTNIGGMYYNDNAEKCFYVGSSGDTVREFIATPQPALIGTRPLILSNAASVNDKVSINNLQITDTTVTTNFTTGALQVAGGVAISGNIYALDKTLTIGSISINQIAAGVIGWNGSSSIAAPTNGNLIFRGQGATDFSILQLGGTTASSAGIKKNGNGIDITDATGFNYTSLAAGNFVVNNNISIRTDDFTLSGIDAGKYTRLAKLSGTQTIALTGTNIQTGHEFTFYRATSAAIALNGGIVNGGTKIASVAQYDSFALKHLGSGTFDFI